MSNVDLVKQIYKHFGDGNNHIAKTLCNPKIEWTVCQGLPFISDKTTFIGEQDIEDNIFSALPKFIDNYRIEPEEIFGADDKVVMSGDYEGGYKKTGKVFKASVTHIWTI